MKKTSSFLFVLLLGLLISPVWAMPDGPDDPVPAKTWNIDASHSTVQFSIKHFFTPVAGTFDKFSGELQFDPADLAGSSVTFSIETASVNTRNQRRDNHLQSGDFFDAETYPTMTFASERFEAAGEHTYNVHGKLTIRDVTQDVVLSVKFLGVQDLPERMARRTGASQVAAFEMSYTLKRNDFGVGTGNWAATAVVGDEVKVNVALEVTG